MVVALVVFEYSTHTGSLKMPPTNISKSSALTSSTMPFVAIPKSIGFVIQFTSIVNCVDLHQLERAHVVLAKDTDMPKLMVDHVVLHGVAEIVSAYVVIVKKCIIFYTFIYILLL